MRRTAMKIAFILEHYYPYVGGVETLFKQLTENLAQENEVIIFTTRFKTELPRFEQKGNLSIYRLAMNNRFAFTFFAAFAIGNRVKDADLIVTTSYNAAVPAWLLKTFYKKKAVIVFHEVWAKLWWKLPFLNIFQRLGFSTFEQFILKLPFEQYVAVSNFTKSKLIESGIPHQKIERIYNGINYDEFVNFQHQAPKVTTFCYFGRLGVSKGLDILLPAFAEHLKTNPDHLLKLVVPKYPKKMFSLINKLIYDLGVRNNLIMLHELNFEEVKKEVSSSTCVVIPSYSEGFCFAAVETMAMNVPIIHSGRGALQEVLAYEENALTMKNLGVSALIEQMNFFRNGKIKEANYSKGFGLEEANKSYRFLLQGVK